MEITFDARKDAINRKKHGISLSRALEFDFRAALISVDDRKDYGEIRFRAISFLDARLHVLNFTESENGIRAISLRKAERSEVKEYADQ